MSAAAECEFSARHGFPQLMVNLLMRAAPQMSAAELGEFAEACSEDAWHRANEAQAVAMGIAMLVDADGHAGQQAGNFQSADDVSSLALHFAGTFGAIAGLVAVAQEARAMARGHLVVVEAKRSHHGR